MGLKSSLIYFGNAFKLLVFIETWLKEIKLNIHMNSHKYIKVTSFKEDWENIFSQYRFRCLEGEDDNFCIAKLYS